MDDDDFQEARPRTSGVIAAAAAKKREKKAASSSSRAPKPTSVHVQVIGGGGGGDGGDSGAGGCSSGGSNAAPSPMAPPPRLPSGAAGASAQPRPTLALASPPPAALQQRASPGSWPSLPLGPAAINSSAPPSVAPTPSKKPAAKRKVASTPVDDGADEPQPVKPKAARTPKAATPRSSTPKSATPASGSRAREDDVASLVEAHLLARNKPLNGQMISDGLLGDGHKVSRAAAEKQLAILVEQGVVTVGEWNKAKLWWPTQERLSATDDAGIDQRIEALQARLPALKAAGLATAREVSERSKLPSFEQLAEQLATEEKACDVLRARIASREAKAKSEAAKTFTPAEAKKIRAQFEKLQKEWGRRKLMLRERLQEYAEEAGKKMAALVDDLGIELDEDVDVDSAQYGVRCKWPIKAGK
ncbi:hypothetical protein KFE25_002557 [Diacronema lutheri]|uniref:Homologous-pairing protein 2 homolog n=1 Tax=Diacronema lutheri TaxID=2081491 RepID=A0A8J5X9R7_DIALT|nr:hypothetical protein KFE25_002557 [Diacronema lutheri]